MMRRRGMTGSRWWVGVPLLAVMAMPAGCGYRRPSLVGTEALITLDGEPVPEASVLLVPVSGGRPISGAADAAGRLVFSTYGSRDGVPAGDYKAVVSKLVLTAKATRKVESLRARAGASEEALDEVLMGLSDDDYRNVLPERYASIDTTDLAVTIDRRSRQIVLALVSETPAK